MTHNNRCEGADPKSRCRCSCGGRHHGENHEFEKEHIGKDRSVNEHMGGELGEMIKKLTGQVFQCTCRKHKKTWEQNTITLGAFLAYPHDGGLADKDGNKWWLYHTCPHCQYDWSWWKLDNGLERQKERKK